MSSPLLKTLTQLEKDDWGPPPAETSYLVSTCHQLRHKPLKDFSTEDLRIMIGQDISLKWLMPLAVETLEKDPLAEGDYYPGDLLKMVLDVDKAFWDENQALGERVRKIAADLRASKPGTEPNPTVTEALGLALDAFLGIFLGH